jgi:ubiquinone/menaquinone biosynthesis C-methylase UbiE
MENKIKKFEDIYSKPNKAPWTYSRIPKELKELISKKIIPPKGKILEIGCGEGHHALFLARKGFDVTAIDQSKNSIKFAKLNAKNARVNFKIQDYRKIKNCSERFNFIFDWRFLHEITDERERKNYIKFIIRLLKPKGKYLTVSFSGDSDFMGKGKLRISPAGIKIYFSKLAALKNLVSKRLRILDTKIISVPQKPNLKVRANYLLAEKKLRR